MTKRTKSLSQVPTSPARVPADPAAQLLAMFLSGKSQKTIDAYKADLEDFRASTGAATTKGAAQLLLSSDQFGANKAAHAYKAHMMDRKLKPATVNRRLAALRSLVQLARSLGVVNWTLEVKNLKSQTYRETRGPGKPAIRNLLDTLEQKAGRRVARDRAILLLLFDLGLRRNEIVTLDVADYDAQGTTVSVIGKGNLEKVKLTLPARTRQAIEAWLDVRGREPGPLFKNFDRAKKGDGRITGMSIYRIVRDLGDELGIRARPHGLRHTAITEAVRVAQLNGLGLEEVLDFSRHKDVTTLMIYRDKERDVQGMLAALVAEST